MTPAQFRTRLKKSDPEPAYLFLGPDAYERSLCRQALLAKVLPSEEAREEGFTHHSLDQTDLLAAIDDARSASLFASERVIWLGRAEAALPKGRTGGKTEDLPGVAALASYLENPPPGTVLVLDCSRYGYEGDDKTKLQRVEKFYSMIPAKVEFRPYSPQTARSLAQNLAKERDLKLGLGELTLLLEATANDAARISLEVEKLSLYVGTERAVTADDIAELIPDAQSANVFALVGALGRGDRQGALRILDLLAREGEYMPLALTFLATQFRMALAAREAGMSDPRQIQGYFNKLGARIWPERARQIAETARAFPRRQLSQAIIRVAHADRALREPRPDDRIVMEEMIVALTGKSAAN